MVNPAYPDRLGAPFYRLLAEHANDILGILDADGRVRYVNPAVRTLLGHAPEALLGRDVRELVHADDLDLVETNLAKVAANPGRVVTTPCRARHADGGHRMMEARGAVHDHPVEGPLLVLVIRDITRQYRQDRLLRCWMDGLLTGPLTSERIFGQCCAVLTELFDLDLAFAARKEADGTLRLLAHACRPCDQLKRLMEEELRWDETRAGSCLADGLRAGQMRVYRAGDAAFPHWHAEVGAICVLPLRTQAGIYGAQVLCSHDPNSFDDGETRDLLAEFAAQLGLTLDMLDKQSRLAMLGGALSAAANAIFITDRDGVIEWVNDAFTALTGYRPEEAIGRTPRMLRSGLHDAEYYGAMRKHIRAGKPWHGEIIDRRKDGAFYTAEQSITPILEGRRQIRHFVAIQQDITERKRLEREVQDLAKNIEHARLSERGQIARQIHDELGGSLASLRHDIEWLLARASEPAHRERLEIMLELAIQSLASARQVAAGLRPTLVEELGLIEALGWLAREFKQHHEMAVGLALAPELDQLTRVQAAEAYRVVQECLTNVAKHAHAGKVHIEGRLEADNLILEVTDDGVGLPPSAQTLGTRGMAERAHLMGGRLEIDRIAGSGTRVRLITPLRLKEAKP